MLDSQQQTLSLKLISILNSRDTGMMKMEQVRAALEKAEARKKAEQAAQNKDAETAQPGKETSG